jgi:toxin FitB
MNVVDSSAWLEYLANGTHADFFAPAVENTRHLLVPSLTLYEVFKRVFQQRDEDHALQAVALMSQGQVIDLDGSLALSAARIRIEHRLPMADSVILATARAHRATLWTLDADFMGMPGVQYRSHRHRSDPDGSGRVRDALSRGSARQKNRAARAVRGRAR